MDLIPRAIILHLILFTSTSLRLCLAKDCGGSHVSRTIVVAKSGKAAFKTVQAAIDSVPANNRRWVKIHIEPGIYEEKVQIPYDKPCVFLEGSGRDRTTITYNGHQEMDNSATFSSSPNNVVVKGITFKNSFNVGGMLNMEQNKGGREVVPALAARIYGDKSAFYGCGFIGYQDTLWDAEGRHYFKSCLIQGAIDFIFGRGQSYFEDCTLNATSTGFITAQGRKSKKDPSGFVFRRGEVIGNGHYQTFLGRAYGPYSRVIFHETTLGSVVAPQGWSAWYFGKQKADITYAEIGCRGPGANTSQRVPWVKTMRFPEVNRFSMSAFINHDGWLGKLPLK